jgi:hypothetical protein
MARNPYDYGDYGWAGSAENNAEDMYGGYKGYSGGQAQAGAGGALGLLMTGNPYLAGAGMGLKTLGTGMDIVGAYKQNERQDDMEAEARAEMQRQRALQGEDRMRRQHLEDVGAAMDYGNYSGKQEDRLMNQYLDYYRKMGY